MCISSTLLPVVLLLLLLLPLVPHGDSYDSKIVCLEGAWGQAPCLIGTGVCADVRGLPGQHSFFHYFRFFLDVFLCGVLVAGVAVGPQDR